MSRIILIFTVVICKLNCSDAINIQTKKSVELNIGIFENLFDDNNDTENEQLLPVAIFESDDSNENENGDENGKVYYSSIAQRYSGYFYKSIFIQLLSDIFWLGKNKYI
jgi:hypothetical protein